MMNSALLSSSRMDWPTPVEVYTKINQRWNFDRDIAADSSNALVPDFISAETDALQHPELWGQRNWCNPPYGRGIGKWIHAAAEHTAATCMLVPARTDTAWFREAFETCDRLVFVCGRLRFQGGKHAAPFPSVLVEWRPWPHPGMSRGGRIRTQPIVCLWKPDRPYPNPPSWMLA